MDNNPQTINLERIKEFAPILDEYGIGDDFIIGEVSGKRIEKSEILLDLLQHPFRFDGYCIFFLKKGG